MCRKRVPDDGSCDMEAWPTELKPGPRTAERPMLSMVNSQMLQVADKYHLLTKNVFTQSVTAAIISYIKTQAQWWLTLYAIIVHMHKQMLQYTELYEMIQVAQLSQRNRAAAWVSFGWP